VWLQANRNSENTRLVKAVLVAGLYPNLVKCAPSAKPGAPPRLTYLSEQGPRGADPGAPELGEPRL
jgi:ATP-dependent RNA helicase DHX57